MTGSDGPLGDPFLDQFKGNNSDIFQRKVSRFAAFFPSQQTDTSELPNKSQELGTSQELYNSREPDDSRRVNMSDNLNDWGELSDPWEVDGSQEPDVPDTLDDPRGHDDAGPTYAEVVGTKPPLSLQTQQNDLPSTPRQPRSSYPRKSPSPLPRRHKPSPPKWRTVGREGRAIPSTRQARSPTRDGTRRSSFNGFETLSRNQSISDSEGLEDTEDLQDTRKKTGTEVAGDEDRAEADLGPKLIPAMIAQQAMAGQQPSNNGAVHAPDGTHTHADDAQPIWKSWIPKVLGWTGIWDQLKTWAVR